MMQIPNENEQSAFVSALFCVALFLMLVLTSVSWGQHVVHYTSPVCGPCQTMKPEIAGMRQAGIDVRVIDVSQQPTAGVDRVPLTQVFDGEGKLVRSFLGPTTAGAISQCLPTPAWQPPIRNDFEPRWEFTPPAAHHAAAVKVNGGSGVYVSFEGLTGVLTAAHVGNAPIEWRDGTTSSSANCHRDKFHHDVAFIVAEHPTIKPLAIASEDPQEGQPIEVVGFGGVRRAIRHYTGRVLPGGPDDHFVLSCAVAAGDSGGGILNDRHEVISVVSAGENGEWSNEEARAHPQLVCPQTRPLRSFLRRVVARVRARRDRPQNQPLEPLPGRGGDGYDHWYPPQGDSKFPPQPPPQPQQNQPPPPTPGGTPGCDCDERWSDLDAWRGEVDGRLGGQEQSLAELRQQSHQAGALLEQIAIERGQADKRLDQLAGRTDDIANQQEGDGRDIDGILGVLSRQSLDERTTPTATYGWTKWALAAAGITGPLGLLLAGVTTVGVSRLKKRISDRRDSGGSRSDGF